MWNAKISHKKNKIKDKKAKHKAQQKKILNIGNIITPKIRIIY